MRPRPVEGPSGAVGDGAVNGTVNIEEVGRQTRSATTVTIARGVYVEGSRDEGLEGIREEGIF